MVTDPGLDPPIVTEQLPLERVHVFAPKETDPVPFCVQVTVPVGECPVTLTVQVTFFDEAAETLAGVQETVVLEVIFATVRLCVPCDWKFLESPRTSP